MSLEFQYQLCPTLLLADLEMRILRSRFCMVLNSLSDEIRAQTLLFGIILKLHKNGNLPANQTRNDA